MQRASRADGRLLGHGVVALTLLVAVVYAHTPLLPRGEVVVVDAPLEKQLVLEGDTMMTGKTYKKMMRIQADEKRFICGL